MRKIFYPPQGKPWFMDPRVQIIGGYLYNRAKKPAMAGAALGAAYGTGKHLLTREDGRFNPFKIGWSATKSAVKGAALGVAIDMAPNHFTASVEDAVNNLVEGDTVANQLDSLLNG